MFVVSSDFATCLLLLCMWQFKWCWLSQIDHNMILVPAAGALFRGLNQDQGPIVQTQSQRESLHWTAYSKAESWVCGSQKWNSLPHKFSHREATKHPIEGEQLLIAAEVGCIQTYDLEGKGSVACQQCPVTSCPSEVQIIFTSVHLKSLWEESNSRVVCGWINLLAHKVTVKNHSSEVNDG